MTDPAEPPRRCQNCRFYVVAGNCRRYPPTLVGLPTTEEAKQYGNSYIDWWQAWPAVSVDDWCGEHKFP